MDLDRWTGYLVPDQLADGDPWQLGTDSTQPDRPLALIQR